MAFQEIPAGVEPNNGFERALSAYVRAEFEAPVASLQGMIAILAEDAAAAGLSSYEADLRRMIASGQRLGSLVSALLGEEPEGRRLPIATLRHDLRTPISSIIGYGELLAEEARDRGDTALFEPLADTLDAAGRLLSELDRLVLHYAGGPASAESAAGPDVLQRAVEVVNRLASHAPAGLVVATGRILVVDDNPSVRDLVSRRLLRDGHKVSVCGSGHAALDMTERGAFDLMLLDLMMPGLDGLEVLARLRARPATKSLPVIVISALDEVEAAVRCIGAGADDFLSKPVNETLLRARIGSSLERKFLRDREQDALRRLQLEQDRSDALLRNVLPARVVERLHAGETVIADHFDDVTVLFCDLVGFTALSAAMPPADTLVLLNEIFSGFDDLAERHGLEKIKTIGDAYMAVGGMSEPDADHARRVVEVACAMPACVARAAPDHALAVRIGVDTGPAVGGIIGRHKFFYDLWGDTVNTASRLEAACEPGCIHVSAETRNAVGDRLRFTPRPPIHLKGKGEMQTFYVDQAAGLANPPVG